MLTRDEAIAVASKLRRMFQIEHWITNPDVARPFGRTLRACGLPISVLEEVFQRHRLQCPYRKQEPADLIGAIRDEMKKRHDASYDTGGADWKHECDQDHLAQQHADLAVASATDHELADAIARLRARERDKQSPLHDRLERHSDHRLVELPRWRRYIATELQSQETA